MFTKLQRIRRTYARTRVTVPLFVLTQAVYIFMLTTTIPRVMGYAGGMELFDMQPTGYSAEYARALLGQLGEAGRHAYLTRQLPADALYPGLFALTYTLLLTQLFRYGAGSNRWLRRLSVVPVAAGMFDYLENIGVALMLTRYPAFSPLLAHVTSLFSVVKSVATVLALILLAVGAVLAVVRWRAASRTARRSPAVE